MPPANRRCSSRSCAVVVAAAALLALTSTSVTAQPLPAPAPAPDTAPVPDPAPAPDTAPVPDSAPIELEPAPAVPPVPAPPIVEPPVATEPASSDKPSPLVAVTYDKGLTFASADEAFQLRIAFRNQLRFELTRPLEDDAEASSRLLVPRMRIQFEGHVFGKDTRYKVELAAGDRGSFSFVRDVFVEKALADHVWLRLGQWKRPFNRHELVSDFSGTFNERANVAELVGGGRDVGVAVHNDYEKSPDGLEWAVGMFNNFNGGLDRPTATPVCTGEPLRCSLPAFTTVPADMSPALVARVGWNLGGIKGYSEGDLEGGPLRLAVGLSYKIDLAQWKRGAEDSVSDNLSHGLQADALLKVAGLDVEAGVYMMKLKSADAELGYLLQAGYFVLPRQLQLAGRFAWAPQSGDREQLEMRAAVNWYWQGHAWKVATDAGFVKLTGEDATGVEDDPDLQLRAMTQLTF